MTRTLIFLLLGLALRAEQPALSFLNNNRPVADAHNCYPYEGRWSDRIDRALKGGFPVGIEQDLAWYVDPATGKGRVVVSHTPKTTGSEPALRDYFFERVRPLVEEALRKNNRRQWPLIVVHFDVKDNQPALLRALWNLLGEYQGWITTAAQPSDPHTLAAFDPKPLLVLTEDNDLQEQIFFKELKPGERLRLFGSAHTASVKARDGKERMRLQVATPPEELLTEPPSNYRRWWNNGWSEVEEGGQMRAGDWTANDTARLKALVDHAHRLGYWIRFYTLDGFEESQDAGWGRAYNFGSRQAVEARWKAAAEAGVDLIASDQYEDLSAFLRAQTSSAGKPGVAAQGR